MNPASSTDSRVSLRARLRTATREAILDAAAGILGSDGATQARMEDIAAKAGVAVGTVYNYFEDRRALVQALLETQTRTLLEVVDQAVAPPASPRRRATVSAEAGAVRDAFEASLERFVSALLGHVDAKRFLLHVLHEEEAEHGVDARSAARRLTVMGELLTRAERLMDAGIRSKTLRKDDPGLYASLLLGMVRGASMRALREGHDAAASGTATIVRVFLSGAAR